MSHRLVLACAAFFIAASAAGASAAQEPRYFRVSAQVSISYRLEYGDNPRAVYNGSYFKSVAYRVRAILVFDGKRASLLPGASMVISGGVLVNDNRTQGVTGGPRKRPTCAAKGQVQPGSWESQTGGGERERFQFTTRGNVSVASDGLRIDPGTALVNVGCSATESPPNHGLRGGPGVTVSAPAKSWFSGTTSFSTHCVDSYSHPMTNEIDGNGHAFDGTVEATVTLTPFPATKLTAVKQALRDSVGVESGGLGFSGQGRDCIR